MNATTTFRRSALDFGFSTSPGTSFEAGLLSEKIKEFLKGLLSAYTLHGQANRELEDTFLDCRAENWDGYEALPVADRTFLRAQDFLTQVIDRFPAPTVSATPNGSLAFEWFVSPKRRFLVSLGEEERVAFAGFFGSDPVYGTTLFTRDLPQEIAQHLRRLFFL